MRLGALFEGSVDRPSSCKEYGGIGGDANAGTHLPCSGRKPQRFQETRALAQQLVRDSLLVHLQSAAMGGHVAGYLSRSSLLLPLSLTRPASCALGETVN